MIRPASVSRRLACTYRQPRTGIPTSTSMIIWQDVASQVQRDSGPVVLVIIVISIRESGADGWSKYSSSHGSFFEMRDGDRFHRISNQNYNLIHWL